MVRTYLAVLVVLATSCWANLPPAAAADPVSGAAITDLKSLLEKGLKARRQVEFDFVATVVAKVDSGELPESLVRSTFYWARQKPSDNFQYFQFGIRERAKRIGVTL